MRRVLVTRQADVVQIALGGAVWGIALNQAIRAGVRRIRSARGGVVRGRCARAAGARRVSARHN